MTKRILLPFLLLLTFYAPFSSWASHNAGAQITLECVNACTTKVEWKTYRDCTGATVVPRTLDWSRSYFTCSTLPTQIGTYVDLPVVEATPVCPSYTTGCDTNSNPQFFGIKMESGYAIYDVCSVPACQYVIGYWDCCRNGAITSLANAGGQDMYVGHVRLMGGPGSCNSSVVYTNPPILYHCAGQPKSFDMGGIDPDGDSLRFFLSNCMQEALIQVYYEPGFTFDVPMGPSWDCNLDSLSGQLTLTPQPGNVGVSVVCITTEEYRNGQLIGTSFRDMEVVTSQCQGVNQSPVIQQVRVASGHGGISGHDVYLCSGLPVCIDITGFDSDAGQLISSYLQNPIPGMSYFDPLNPSVTDTIRKLSPTPFAGRLCFTAPASGSFSISVVFEDSYCPFNEKIVYPLNFHVGNYGTQFNATVTPAITNCTSYDFDAQAFGCQTSGAFSYVWSGAGGVSSTSPQFSYQYPGPGSYPWQVIADDGQNFRDTIVGTAIVTQTATWTQLMVVPPTIVPCNGITSVWMTADSGYVSYQWSTGDTTQSIRITQAGSYSVTVATADGCLFRDNKPAYRNPPDLSGIVSTHLGQPMNNQKVRLIKLEPSPLALIAIDSILTDSAGYFQFCNVTDTNVYVKVSPSQSLFPTDMPTYADSTLFWNQAHLLNPLLNGATQQDIHTVFGQNPGGPGFIGGLVSQGANKADSIGDPVSGLRLFLKNVNLDQIIGYRDTDANGYFSFSNLPVGSYEVLPDHPFVDEGRPPQIVLTNEADHRDNLDFRFHSLWLELVNTVAVQQLSTAGMQIDYFPNPFKDQFTIQISLEKAAKISFEIFDLRGKQITKAVIVRLQAGVNKVKVGEELPVGIFFVRLKINGISQVLKIAKI